MKKILASKNFLMIFFALSFSVVTMSVAYANLSGLLDLNGTAVIKGEWDVRINSIEEFSKNGGAYSIDEPSHTKLNANFNAMLVNPGDSIKYKVTVKNNGNIDARLKTVHIIPEVNESDVILYSTYEIYNDEILKAGDMKTFFVEVRYNTIKPVESQSKSVLISLEYVQKD